MLLAAIRIDRLKNFYSELQLINTDFVWSRVSFSGQGEKLLERKKCLGHNMRQYSNLFHGTSLIKVLHTSELWSKDVTARSHGMMLLRTMVFINMLIQNITQSPWASPSVIKLPSSGF